MEPTSVRRRRWPWVLTAVGGLLLLWLVWGAIAYTPLYVFRVLAWQESDAFDWQKFPARQLEPSPNPAPFEHAADENVPRLLAELAGVEDWTVHLADNQTQAFLIVQEGVVRYEAYFNDTQRDSIVTSFSVAKSFTSALVGIAIDDGHIGSAEDPITDYLPELAARDPAFERITIEDLLRMASGFDYREFRFPGLNSDDPLTTYHPDQRWLSLHNTHIVDPPGSRFLYNKYHPQLLGMILERTTGMAVTEYMQVRLWDQLGMEYGGSWSLDSEANAFERMEAGLNARAVDFAKFGQLYLQGGTWRGVQVIPASWVTMSTAPYHVADSDYYPAIFDEGPTERYYGYMWWGYQRPDGTVDFYAAGDKGQYIYISPANGLVIVRHGIDFGETVRSWPELFYAFSSQYAFPGNQ